MRNSILYVLVFIIFSIIGCKNSHVSNDVDWINPLVHMDRLQSPLVEVEPFIFNNKFYLLECWRSNWKESVPLKDRETKAEEEMWIVHLPDGPNNYDERQYLSIAMQDNSLGTAIVSEGKIYVFGVNESSGRQYVEMTWSEDLINWSVPKIVFDSPSGKIFNVSITRDDKGFIFLWETDGLGTNFTMCFGRINKLTDYWNDYIIQDAVYGKDKYTGGPAVYFVDNWYYLLYLERLKEGWETRITRSKDLIFWEDAPIDRPFISYNKNNKELPYHEPHVHEINASDPALITYKGEVIVYFTGGIQRKAGDLQWASFKGSLKDLMSNFFK